MSPAVMITPVTVLALALTTVTARGGPFCFGEGFGAFASGAAPAGAEPGTSGMLMRGCATAGVRPRTRAAQVSPVMRE